MAGDLIDNAIESISFSEDGYQLLIDLNESALESAGVSRFGETNLYLSYQEPADGGGLVSEAGNAVHNLDQYNIWYNPSSSDVDSLNGWSFNREQNAIELYFDESVNNVGDSSLYSVYGDDGTQIANAVNSVGFNSDWGDNTIFITLNLDALETAGVNSQEQLYVEYSGPDAGSGLEGLTRIMEPLFSPSIRTFGLTATLVINRCWIISLHLVMQISPYVSMATAWIRVLICMD